MQILLNLTLNGEIAAFNSITIIGEVLKPLRIFFNARF